MHGCVVVELCVCCFVPMVEFVCVREWVCLHARREVVLMYLYVCPDLEEERE